ncbi:hypothetical protein [Neptuniibacter halophilus]|uniref:hypothetical protein n=1 Tax=Neptuniibacter halophilus TaxID=651666 RepID=UPI0025731C60|nr:hypothetical protein [Neptuniibacter halophilus]
MIDKQDNSQKAPHEIPEDLRRSKGFIFHFPQDNHRYHDLYSDLDLRENLKEFLSDILEIVGNGVEYCSFEQITTHLSDKNKPSGKTLIYSRVKNLTETGLLQEDRYYRQDLKLRNIKIYTLGKPILKPGVDAKYLAEEAKPVGDNNKSAEAERKLELLRNQFDDQMLSKPSNRSYRDMIMSSMLAKCIRLDSHDQRQKLETHFSYKDEAIDVTTTTQIDGSIAMSSDIRYTMVITTFTLEVMLEYINKYGDPEKKPDNVFVIDLSEVCTHIGNKRTAGNRLTAYRAIKRLYQTNFEIRTPQESEFARQFLEGYNEANYRFLTDFRALMFDLTEEDDLFTNEPEENLLEGEIKNPRWIRISLWTASFDSMWSQAVARYHAQQSEKAAALPPIVNFIQNPEVVKNPTPLTYQLYSHISAWVGVSGHDKKACSVSDLHFYMLRTSRYQNFLRSLIKVLNSVQDPDKPQITNDTAHFKVNLYGYFIEGTSQIEQRGRKGFYLTFSRDTKDKFIGDRSRHNQLKALANAQEIVDSQKQTEPDSSPVEGEYMAGPAQLAKLREELNKDPDDPSIAKAKIMKPNNDGSWDLEPYEMFPEANS